MTTSRVLWAIDNEIEARAFERLCVDLLAREGYQHIIPVGGVHDRGRDAELRESSGVVTFFQYSLEDRWQSKLRRELKKVKNNGHSIDIYVFVTTGSVTGHKRDSLITEVLRNYGWQLVIFDREWLRNRLEDQHPDLAYKYLGIAETSIGFGTHSTALNTSRDSRASGFLPTSPEEHIVVAMLNCRRQLSASPNNDDLWEQLSYYQYELRQFDEALISINEALKLRPNTHAYEVAKAVILAEDGMAKHDRVELLLAKRVFAALIDNSSDWLDHYNYANILSALGEYKLAKAEYQHATIIAPYEAVIWNNLGNVHLALRETNEALQSFDLALRYEPALEEALANKGILLLETLGKADDAVLLFEQVMQTTRGKSLWKQGWYWLALSLLQLNKLEDALSNINRGLEVQPSHVGLLNLKAEIYAQLWRADSGQVEEAIDFFQFLFDVGGATLYAASELAEIYLYQKDAKNAAHILEISHELPTGTLDTTIELALTKNQSDIRGYLDVVIPIFKHYPTYKLFRSHHEFTKRITFLSLNNVEVPQSVLEDMDFTTSAPFCYAYERLLNAEATERLDILLDVQSQVAKGLRLAADQAHNIFLQHYRSLSATDQQSLKAYFLMFRVEELTFQMGWMCGRLNLPTAKTTEMLSSDDNETLNELLLESADSILKTKSQN